VLGPDYTIAVTRGAFEAIAVKQGVGHIKGCEDGDLCPVDRLPMPERCDQGFSVTALDLEIQGQVLRLVNGHPDSISVNCRAEEVGEAFKAVVPGRTIMAGDWNLDPYHDHDQSAKIWKQGLESKGFKYLSGIAVHDPPYYTDFLPLINAPFKAIDHVVTDFAKGPCQVLGVSPGTKQLDGHFDLDHRAILCEIEF
jgi:hypothetical protein